MRYSDEMRCALVEKEIPTTNQKREEEEEEENTLSLSLSLRERGGGRDLCVSLSLFICLIRREDTPMRFFFPHKKWRKVFGKKSNTKRKKSTHDVGKRRSADVDRRCRRDSSREVLVFFAPFDQREVFFSSSLFSSERCFFIIFFW